MKEHNIKFELGTYWIADSDGQYTVYKTGMTHSTADSSYPRTDDGFSLAKARVGYLVKRDATKIATQKNWPGVLN